LLEHHARLVYRRGHLDEPRDAAAGVVATAVEADAVQTVVAGVTLGAGVAARAHGTDVALLAVEARETDVARVALLALGTGVTLERGDAQFLHRGQDGGGHVGLLDHLGHTIAQQPDQQERAHDRSQDTHLFLQHGCRTFRTWIPYGSLKHSLIRYQSLKKSSHRSVQFEQVALGNL